MTQFENAVNDPNRPDSVHTQFIDMSPINLIRKLALLPHDVKLKGLIVAVLPSKTKPNPYYQHPNGTTKSIKYRSNEALAVDCPRCGAKGTESRPGFSGDPCLNMNYIKTSRERNKYPHAQRTKEAQRQARENQPTLPESP